MHAKFRDLVYEGHVTHSSYDILRDFQQYRRFSYRQKCIHVCSGSSIVDEYPGLLTRKLQRVQNALIRVICSLGPRDSVSGARRDLHWLPIEQRIIFKIAVLTFNCRRRSAPPYLCDLVHDYLPRRTLRSGDGVTLEVPRTKTVTAERAFSVAAPTIWNALPLKLRQSKHFSRFKTELKTHLFTTC